MTAAASYSGIDISTGKGITVNVKGSFIESIKPCDDPDLPVLSPGLIDLQINGYNGLDLNSGDLQASDVEALSDALCQVGVSAYLPTLITAGERSLCQRLHAIKLARQTQPRSSRMIAGIHVEGPSISHKPGPRGAHPEEHVRPPSIEEFARWQEAADGLVRMITIAPEVDGAIEYISHLSSQGVCVSLGHSDATERDIQRSVEAGACMSTHLGNGIRDTLPRHPNAIWAQLAEDRLHASLILDGYHLPRSAALSMIRAKGTDRVILVSDSVRFAGMAAGRYSSPIGGEVDVSTDGRVSMAGTPYLAGSGMCLLDIIVRFTRFIGLPLASAVTMATHNPARILGRSATIQAGAQADFILFDHISETGETAVRDIVFDGVSVA